MENVLYHSSHLALLPFYRTQYWPEFLGTFSLVLARRKSKKKESLTQDQAENLQEQINEGTNVENTNEESNKKQNPYGVIVLGVYMHCQGCADTITKYLRGSDGIVFDQINHRLATECTCIDR